MNIKRLNNGTILDLQSQFTRYQLNSPTSKILKKQTGRVVEAVTSTATRISKEIECDCAYDEVATSHDGGEEEILRPVVEGGVEEILSGACVKGEAGNETQIDDGVLVGVKVNGKEVVDGLDFCLSLHVVWED